MSVTLLKHRLEQHTIALARLINQPEEIFYASTIMYNKAVAYAEDMELWQDIFEKEMKDG